MTAACFKYPSGQLVLVDIYAWTTWACQDWTTWSKGITYVYVAQEAITLLYMHVIKCQVGMRVGSYRTGG